MGAERIDPLFLGKAHNGCMCLDHILPNESAKVGRDLVTLLREGWTDENGHHTVPVCWPSDCPKCGEGWLVMHRRHVLRQVTKSGDIPAPPSILALPELLAIKKPSKAELQALGY